MISQVIHQALVPICWQCIFVCTIYENVQNHIIPFLIHDPVAMKNRTVIMI